MGAVINRSGDTTLAKSLFRRAFKALLVCTVSIAALGTTTASAGEAWSTLQLVDMTTSADLGGDMVVTTGFLHQLDLVAFQQPQLSIAPDGLSIQSIAARQDSGWSGLVEVDIDDDLAAPIRRVSAFSDTFAQRERETRMSGFYTMRYQFETDLPFRPYAGAGLGLVTSETASRSAGIIAGRATAGFDFAVSEQSAIYAEYAYVQSGGVTLGSAGSSSAGSLSIPDTEHTLKFGFRRTF